MKLVSIFVVVILFLGISINFDYMFGWLINTYLDFVAKLDISMFIAVNALLASVFVILICAFIGTLIDECESFKSNKVNNIGFIEKHRLLSFAMGFCMIVALVTATFIFVRQFIYSLKICSDLIVSFISAVSKLDAVIIVALITGGVSIVGVLFSTVVSKIIDYKKSRREYLAKKREDIYVKFVGMFYKLQRSIREDNYYTEEMMLEDIADFSEELTLWGSKKVVKKWIEFRKISLEKRSDKENLFIIEGIMNEMRKDLGVEKLKKGNILSFVINDFENLMHK